MAKRVIQMYDKYKSTTKTYPKIIKECLQKDVTDYIEGQVEANPTLAGTEAELTGLQVGDTKYKVPQGTQVVANPDPAGTTELTGLQIGDTKYKINTGKQLYQHNVSFIEDTSGYEGIMFPIINDSPTAFTKSTLANWLYNKGYNNKIWGCSGKVNDGSTKTLYGINGYQSGELYAVIVGGTSCSIRSISDDVDPL